MQFGIGNNSSNMSISSKENAFEIIIFLSSTSLWIIRGVYEKLLSSNIYQKKKKFKNCIRDCEWDKEQEKEDA